MYDLDILFVVVYLSPHEGDSSVAVCGGLKEGNERIEPDLA